MKIVRVALNDYDKLILGELVVEDGEVDATLKKLRSASMNQGEASEFVIEVRDPAKITELLAEMGEYVDPHDQPPEFNGYQE